MMTATKGQLKRVLEETSQAHDATRREVGTLCAQLDEAVRLARKYSNQCGHSDYCFTSEEPCTCGYDNLYAFLARIDGGAK